MCNASNKLTLTYYNHKYLHATKFSENFLYIIIIAHHNLKCLKIYFLNTKIYTVFGILSCGS